MVTRISTAGFILVILTLFDSTFCKLHNYDLEEHVKIVSYKTKVHLTEEWKNSQLEGSEMSSKILLLLGKLLDEYLFLNSTYQKMLEDHAEASKELNEIILEHVEEEAEIAECIEKACMTSVKSCRFDDVSKDTVEELSSDLASTVKKLESQGINVNEYERIEEAMENSLKILIDQHAELERRRKRILEILHLHAESLRIVRENEMSFEKILDEAEKATFRGRLGDSKDDVLQQIQILQDILSDNSNESDGVNQKRRRRGVETGSGGKYVPKLSYVAPADCGEVESVGGWREFCSQRFPGQCSESLADHVTSLAKNFTELNAEIETKQNLFNSHYIDFSALYADLDKAICDFMNRIMWMDMVIFKDKDDPKFNVIKISFDPRKYSIDSPTGDILYTEVIATVEGWEKLEAVSLNPTNVHKYYVMSKEISTSVRRSLEQQACVTGPEEVKYMLTEYCPHLCKFKRY